MARVLFWNAKSGTLFEETQDAVIATIDALGTCQDVTGQAEWEARYREKQSALIARATPTAPKTKRRY